MYNLDGADRIAVEIDVCSIFNVLTFVIDILIKKSIWISFLDVLIIIFAEIVFNSDKQSEFEWNCRNNDYATIITNNFYKIYTTPIVTAFSVDVYYFILPTMNTPSLPIEFEALVVEVGKLMLNFAVPPSNNTISSRTQVRHNVCAVFVFFFRLFVFFACECCILDKVQYCNKYTT